MDLEFLRSLAQPATTKIVLCSLDGLGGLPEPRTRKSELETARLPTLHALAGRSACGLLRHVGPGITPGSGPSSRMEPASTQGTLCFTSVCMIPLLMRPVSTAASIDPDARTWLMARMCRPWPPVVGWPVEVMPSVVP